MKFIRFIGFLLCFAPLCSFGAGGDFQSAAQLLSAARRGEIQTVQYLINSGADVNYVDSSGLSLVCTAVMNNDKRAIQILQMYGADASNCDRQIKKYRQKVKTAKEGESYSFFSGLSSSHVLLLSAVGVAAVLGGVALLTDAFDADNHNSSGPSGGSHSGGGGGSGGGSSGATKWFAVPYGPAYLTSDGKVDTSFDIKTNLVSWDTTTPGLRANDFNYFRIIDTSTDNFYNDGLVSTLQNYLLTMRGYYSFASGYMGQYIFRDSSSKAPIAPAIIGSQMRPVRVALITGNGISPTGSADPADGITYAVSNNLQSSTPTVDKYLNNTLTQDGNVFVETENSGFDLSGSGSAFNIFANVNETALAKIVAGWEGNRASTDADLYGFVPNGQVAIYRTGNGTVWETIEPATDRTEVGTFTDTNNDGLAAGDTVVIGGVTYNIVTALSRAAVAAKPTITIAGKTYEIPTNSKMLIGDCGDGCADIAIYVGTDGAWYVKSSNSSEIDNVYIAEGNTVYQYKTKTTNNPYTNFTALALASSKIYNVSGDPTAAPVDVIANVNTLPNSTSSSYLTADNFTTMASIAGVSDLKTFYNNVVASYYGGSEGGIAHSLFNGYSSSLPMIVMPAGDYLYKDSGGTYYLENLGATFENYAPMIYGNNLKHDFMTVVAVSHEVGTSAASTISAYGDGTGASYGPIVLSKWKDASNNVYSSRICGITGIGNASSGIDPWCFAAAGPTAEMATASAAGAVASVKSAFSYMSNDQIFTLLALTADGPFLGSTATGTRYTTDTLATYLKTMYSLPLSYNESYLSNADYLKAFQEVFGYGLINLERAIKPSYSIYYYSQGNIVSAAGNQFWGVGTTSSSTARASTLFSLTGRQSITTSFFDIVESADGSLSLPRVWTSEIATSRNAKHGLYMGDVLTEFNVNSKNNSENKIGNMTFSMAVSEKAYNDNLSGLDNLKLAFVNEHYDISAQYQRHFTDGLNRFEGRANDLLAISTNNVSSDFGYKIGNFRFGTNVFTGSVTDESLLETDPVISSQFEPARLGFVNGASLNTGYKNDKLSFNVSFGTIHENNTVLGMYSDGLLAMNGANTTYVDTVAKYKVLDNASLYLRGTFADTRADANGGLITNLSNIKSNSFAIGFDIAGLSLTASMPLAVVDGKMGYDYAQYEVVDNEGKYEIAIHNAHTEYIDLSAAKREARFALSYKTALGEFTDAGIGMIYRVNPNNTDAFGNESIFMLKLHHRLGI